MKTGKYAYHCGEIVPIEQAQVPITNHALNYGTGCFEGIRAYWSEDERQLFVFRLPEHYERLAASAHILMMQLPFPLAEMCELTTELLRRNEHSTDTYLRPLMYKSARIIGVRLHDLEEQFSLFTAPFGQYIETEGAARLRTSSWRRVEDTSIPARAKITGSYVNAAFSKSEAMLDGYDEALVLTEDGHVAEGSAENLFAVIGGKLVTPPVSDNILAGITRSTLIQLASEVLGVPTVERSLDRTELYVAQEVFLCGTGAEVVPVGEIDRRRVGTGQEGELTRELRETYSRVVRGRDPRYSDWLTPVYSSEHPAPEAEESLALSATPA
ncbi:MAG: branched-chain amino acid transaminase [Chloroflexota bacterium]|nr:branched-chain amino acid transaminase [Chloroflexota bacterium]